MRLAIALALCLALIVPAAAEEARYRLELQISWSKATHPHDWPEAGGHMSGLVGVTHNSRYVMFADGRTASSGLKLVAENGRAGIMMAEFTEARRRDRIDEVLQADGLKKVPGSIRLEFTVKESHPLVSFVTMLAPSPDWFTGASSVSLRKEGEWIKRLRMPLWVWDAGTDSGSSYLSANMETQPAQSIRLLATPHVLDGRGLAKVGSALLTRLDK
ncbi:MAG: spondin domain-containing protein [Pseudomonadota bacterium]